MEVEPGMHHETDPGVETQEQVIGGNDGLAPANEALGQRRSGPVGAYEDGDIRCFDTLLPVVLD